MVASNAKAFQELSRGQDRNPSKGVQLSEIPVACHEVAGAAGDGAFEELVVVGVSLNDGQMTSHADGIDKRKELFLDQRSDLLLAEAELGVRQDPHVLLEDLSGYQDGDAARLPEGDESRGGPHEE